MATFTYCNLNNVAVQHTTGVPILVYVECDIRSSNQDSQETRKTTLVGLSHCRMYTVYDTTSYCKYPRLYHYPVCVFCLSFRVCWIFLVFVVQESTRSTRY